MTKLDALALATMNGDDSSYRELLNLTAPALRSYFQHRFHLGADAEDLVQETLLAVHTKLHTYRPSQPFMPWLYAVARHKGIDYIRTVRRRTTATEVPLDYALNATAVTKSDAAGDMHVITRALLDLDQRDRDLLQLSKVEGLSLKQVGEQLNLSLSAVKTGIHRAMKRLVASGREGD